jgi:1,4-dihydroxy-2-naphthoate octaprenyltransferase
VNNLRDIKADQAAGKITLAVRMGAAKTRREYALFLGVAYLFLPLLFVLQLIPIWTLVVCFSLPLARKVTLIVQNESGRPLNAALAGTGKIALLYSILFFVGMVIDKII